MRTLKRAYRDIREVARAGLCMGCGTCAGVCPQAALTMVMDEALGMFVPQLDEQRCVQCGRCRGVCPGEEVDFEGISRDALGGTGDDVALGRCRACWMGHATDEKVRFEASSGGIVSSLLLFALESNTIDAALVIRARADRPLEPEAVVARSRQDVLSAMGSRYCPTAVNVRLRDVASSPGRFAVVGLPCQIHGVRKAERADVKLRDKIVLRIGIACYLNYSFLATEVLLRRLAIRREHVMRLDYRGRGWPGSMRIMLRDGSERSLALGEYYGRFGPYSLGRCTLCSDGLAELADVSCGDAWLPEVMQADHLGRSFVVARSEAGERFLQQARGAGAVVLEAIDPRRVLASQDGVSFKKKGVVARMGLRRLLGCRVPVYHQRLMHPQAKDYVAAAKYYFFRYVLSEKHRAAFAVFGGLQRWKRRLTGRGPDVAIEAK